VVHPSTNGSVPPASSRPKYEAELSPHIGTVPDGIKKRWAQTYLPCSLNSQAPDQNRSSKLTDEGCENVL
jgi:hypothetical protein